jgi:hypothetical protein
MQTQQLTNQREQLNDQGKPINSVGIGTVLPGREDDAADISTIKLLHEVETLRRQLRALEPQLSKAITAFGLRRGDRGYREFFLRNALNQQQYTER